MVLAIALAVALAGNTPAGIDVDALSAESPAAGNLARGIWTHTVPLELPPAPGGLVPSLSVTMDPSVGDGWLGPSWRLDGFSKIEATGGTGGVLHVTEAGQRYRIDGEPLVYTGSGYEPEHSDGRIFTYDTAANQWTATRAGWRWVFGDDLRSTASIGRCATEWLDEAAAVGPCTTTLPDASFYRTSAWHLVEVTDPWGNQIHYDYSVHTDADASLLASFTHAWEHLPERISYGPHEIELEWATRDRIYFSARTGLPRLESARLDRITVFASGIEEASYAPDYDDTAIGSAVLASFNRYAATGELRRLRVTQRTAGHDTAFPAESYTVLSETPLDEPQVVSLDGNGVPDLVTDHASIHYDLGNEDAAHVEATLDPEAPTWSANPDGNRDWAWVDVNRDGWTDVLNCHDTANEAYVSDGDGGWSATELFDSGSCELEPAWGQWADLTADGYVDLIVPTIGGWEVYVNQGEAPWFSGAQSFALDLDLPDADCGEFGEGLDEFPPSVVEVDSGGSCEGVGDGECGFLPPSDPDRVLCYMDALADSGCMSGAETASTGFAWIDRESYLESQVRFGDFNGDGVGDVAAAWYQCWTDGSLAASAAWCGEEAVAGVCPIPESLASLVWFGDGNFGFFDAGYDAGPSFLTHAGDGTGYPDPDPDDLYAPDDWPSWDAFGSVDLHGSGRPGIVNSTYGDPATAHLFFRQDLGLTAGYDAVPLDGEALDDTDIAGLEILPGYALDAPNGAGMRIADFDGDGMVDFLSADGDLYESPWSAPIGRVTTIYGSWGGAIELGWSTSVENGNSPALPQVLPTIASVRDADGTSLYSFEGGSFDGQRDRFSGFLGSLVERENEWATYRRFGTSPIDLGRLIYEVELRPDATMASFDYRRYRSADLPWWELTDEPYFNPEIRRCQVELEEGTWDGFTFHQSLNVEDLVEACESFDGASGLDPGSMAVRLGWTRGLGILDVDVGLNDAVWRETSATQFDTPGPFDIPALPPVRPPSSTWSEVGPLPVGMPTPTDPAFLLGGGSGPTNYRMYVVDTSWDADRHVVDVYDHRLSTTSEDDLEQVFGYESWDAVANGKALTSREIRDASSAVLRTWQFGEFAAFDQPGLVRELGEAGTPREWSYAYENGEVVALEDPLGADQSWVRNGLGLPESHTDAEGRVEEFDYDGAGRATARRWEGLTESWTYDEHGRVESWTADSGADGSAARTRTWLRDEVDEGLSSVGDSWYLRQATLDGEVWTDGDGVVHPARATLLWLDRWGRRVQEDQCLVSEVPADLDTLGCDAASTVTVLRQWAADGSLRMQTAPFVEDEEPASTWTWIDGLGRTVVRYAPAPVDPSTPEWVETSFDYRLGAVEATDPLGRSCTTSWSALDRWTSCEGELRGQTRTDVLGRVSQRWDGAGEATIYGYDEFGRVESAGPESTVAIWGSTATAPTWTWTWDLVDRVQTETDPTGVTTTWTWDDVGRPLSATRGSTLLSSWFYTSVGGDPVVLLTDINGNPTLRAVDAMGRAWKTGVADLLETRIYDAAGDLVEVDAVHGVGGDETTITTRLSADARGRVSSVRDAYGETARFYDGRGLTGTLDADGVGTATWYAWDGRPLEQWAGDYDASTGIDEEVTLATWSWRDDGRLASKTEAGATTSFSYDSQGRPSEACVGDHSGSCASTVAWTWDGADRLESEARDAFPATSWAYNALGWTESQTNPDGSQQRWYHDELGRPRHHEDEEGATSDWSWDSLGRLGSQDVPGTTGSRLFSYVNDEIEVHTETREDGTVWVRSYDGLGRPVLEERPDGTATAWSWRGRLLDEATEYDGTSAVARTVYGRDAVGRPTSRWGPTDELSGSAGPESYVVEQAWTAAGRLASIGGPNDRTSFGWTTAGLLGSEVVDGVSSTTVEYDGWGRAGVVTQAGTEPRVLTRSYSADGVHLTGELAVEGTATLSRSWSNHDAFGTARQATVTVDGVVESAFTLATDSRGRVTNVQASLPVTGWSGTLSYGWYRNGAMKRVDATLGTGPALALQYDRSGTDFYLDRVRTGTGVTAAQVTGRDAMGRVTDLSWAGGTTITLGYDAVGRPEGQQVQTGTSWISRAWGWDGRGRVETVDEWQSSGTSHHWDYAYAEPGWLVEEDKDAAPLASYSYDAAGNRTAKVSVDGTTTSYGYAWGNRLTSVNGVENTWNDFGELTEDHRGYGIERQADGSEVTLRSPAGTAVADLVRDAWGRPVGVEGGSEQLRQLWGQPGGSANPMGVWTNTRGRWLNVEVDGLYVGKLTGTGLQLYATDPFGTPMREGTTSRERPESFGTGITGRSRGEVVYAGMEFLPGTPWHLSHHRLYDPETGSFASQDPAGLGGGLHRFGYVNNDPVSLVDPRGLAATSAYQDPDGYGVPEKTTGSGGWGGGGGGAPSDPLRGGGFLGCGVTMSCGTGDAAAAEADAEWEIDPSAGPVRGSATVVIEAERNATPEKKGFWEGVGDFFSSVFAAISGGGSPSGGGDVHPEGRIDAFLAQGDIGAIPSSGTLENGEPGRGAYEPRGMPQEPGLRPISWFEPIGAPLSTLPGPQLLGNVIMVAGLDDELATPLAVLGDAGGLVVGAMAAKGLYQAAVRPTPSAQPRVAPMQAAMEADLELQAGCFVEGTSVQGQLGPIPIETVEVGDRVWARDPETGEEALYEVVRVYTRRSATWRLILQTETGLAEIVTTAEHPFWRDAWDEGDDGFVPARELHTGDVLWTLGGPAVVRSVVATGKVEEVYNLEVEEAHTYFVGRDGVWVHNTSMADPDYVAEPVTASRGGAAAKGLGAVEPELVVTENGAVVVKGEDYNLVGNGTDEWLQIHGAHDHAGMNAESGIGFHTHEPNLKMSPTGDLAGTPRVTTPTTAADLDAAMWKVENGSLVPR